VFHTIIVSYKYVLIWHLTVKIVIITLQIVFVRVCYITFVVVYYQTNTLLLHTIFKIMSKIKKIRSKNPIFVRALNLLTDKVIAEGNNAEDVIRRAEESGNEFILDFQTNPDYHFVF